MTSPLCAQRHYKTSARQISSERSIELAVFKDITARLSRLNGADFTLTPNTAQTLVDNLTLWDIILTDVASSENGLPLGLKNNLIALSKFTRTHTQKIMKMEASVNVLVDINTAIIEGLRQALAPKPQAATLTQPVAL